MSNKKKVIMIIAENKFRDEELFETKEVLEGSGAEVMVASTKLESITGMLGGTTHADILIKDTNVDDYDAVVFVGGSGSTQYFNDPAAHELARSAVEKGKVLGAICIAPSILANAGLLRGKKATAWDSERDNIIRNGGKFTGEVVTVDEDIITGNGPKAASKFATAIISRLL